MAILVAKAAVNVLTKLFQIKIVISNLSVFDLSFFNSLAQNFFCFKKASTLCSGTDIKAVSDPEKNADKRNKIIKITIVIGSISYKKFLFENKKIKLIIMYMICRLIFKIR
jgi:hypothetical protein